MGLNKSTGNKKKCVYVIESVLNHKKYIGATNDYSQRKRRHLSDLRLNRHHSILLQKQYDKYGIDDLKFKIIENIYKAELLIKREQYYLDTLNPEFNIFRMAHSPLGRRLSAETKMKLRKINLGKKLSDETKAKMKGRIPWNKGIKLSIETRNKISKSNKGKKRRPFTELTKQKMSKARKKVKILNTITGEIYFGYRSVPDIEIKISTFEAQLRGQNKNTTKYMLLCQ